MRDVELTLYPGRNDITIEGRDISNAVSSLNIHADNNSAPHLEIGLFFGQLKIKGKMTVGVPEYTKAVLVMLGWTPPVSLANTCE